MFQVNLDELDKYHVVEVGEQRLSAFDEPGEQLRILEADLGEGVAGLFDPEGESLVAFVFNPTMFTEDEARAWVEEHQVEAVAALAAGQDDEAPSYRSKLIELLREHVSKDLFQELVRKARAWKGGKSHGKGAGADDGDEDEDDESDDGVAASAMHVFPGKLADVPETQARALVSEAMAAGVVHAWELIWKEILRPGTFYKWDGTQVVIDPVMIDQLDESFRAGTMRSVSVTAEDHFDETNGVVPAEANRGFVEVLHRSGDGGLFAGLRITDWETNDRLMQGSIQDVSVYIVANVAHPDTGVVYPWVLLHVLLTNIPLVGGLRPFGELAASQQDGTPVTFYRRQDNGQEGQTMPEGAITLSAEEAQRWQAYQAAGLEPAVVQEFAGVGMSADEVRALVAERQATRAKARGLELDRIRLALEGRGEHPGVTQVEGRRHYPVVIEAALSALREQPEGLGLSADGEGQTGLDAVVLAMINAIPAEGRLSAEPGPKGDKEPEAGEPPAASDDGHIDELDQAIGGRTYRGKKKE
jgi:hypothetical protein